MEIMRCVVEDNKDPEHLARVRLRVQGVHGAKLKDVSAYQLPWSEVLNPVDAGNTLGSSTNVKVGTWGFCIPLNTAFTEFLFIGTVKGIFKAVPTIDADGDDIGFRSQDEDYKFPVRLNEADNPLTYGKTLEPDITQSRVTVAEFKEEIDTANKTVYPNNKVYEDHNGNIVEIDGTKDNSRIRIQHSTGARVEISADGDITIQASKSGNIWQETPGLFAIGADGNMIIDCDLKVTGSIEALMNVSAGMNVTAGVEVSDVANTLSDLATEYAAHGHPIVGGSSATASTPPPTVPYTPIPTAPFIWTGTPK